MHSRFRRLCQLQPVLRVHFCDSGASRHNHKKFSPSSCVGRVAQSHAALRAISRLPASANAIRTASVTFPLTPALSHGERENPPLAFSTQRSVCPTNLPNNRICRRLFPLPVGEGQGEGNR